MEENTLENALKQIQAWFVNGEFEKVKQGCEEILQISPNNSIAQDLLQKANEAINPTSAEAEATTPPEPAAANPPPPRPTPKSEAPAIDPITPEPTPAPPIPPLTETEEAPAEVVTPEAPMPEAEPPMPETIVESSNEDAIPMPAAEEHPEDDHHRKHSLIVNVLILVVLIVVGILAVYAYQAIKKDDADTQTPIIEDQVEDTEEVTDDGKGDEESEDTEEVTEETTDEEEVTEEITEDETEEMITPDAEARNNQRLADLTTVEDALMRYYDTHKKYPTAEEIHSILIDEELLEALPVAPLENEAYVYAIYDTDLGPAQVYVLSANFENEDGTTSPWSTGGNVTVEYTDFNDVTQENITILTQTMTEEEYLIALETIMETIAEEEVVVEETDGRVRVPRNPVE